MTAKKEIINYDDLSPDFISTLQSLVGDEVLACLQCGMCTAGCPSAPWGYNIRQIVRLAAWGFKNELLQSEYIWFCTECGKCAERCTQKIKPFKIILGLQQLATKQGNLPRVNRERIKNIKENGCVLELDDLTEMKRDRINLPKRVKNTPEQVKHEIEIILKETDFQDPPNEKGGTE